MAFNFGDIPLILQELRRYFASKAQGTLADSALQPGAIGSTVQAYDADLAAVAAITTAGGIKRTGANTWTTFPLTNAGEAVTGAADAAAQRTALGLTIGSNVQAWDEDLDAIAAISTTGPIERTGAGAWAVSDRVRLFGGYGVEGSFATGVVSTANPSGLTNITLDREVYFFSSFTVNSGHTVTLSSGLTRIYCSGSVTINGTLTGSAFLRGGPNQAEGGLIGSGVSYLNELTGSGIGANRGQVYTWEAQPYGSSGAAASFRLDGTGQTTTPTGGVGGAGGPGIFIEAAAGITIGAAGVINANGGNAQQVTITNAFLSVGPASGGSGGIVHLSSLLSITNNGTINVRGGNGADGQRGASATLDIFGGRAGGGGWAVFIAPTITPGTVNRNAGTLGASISGTSAWGGPAGASFAGRGGSPRTPFEAAENGQIVTRTIKPVT